MPDYRIKLCLQAKWHDSKQPWSLMLPGQKPVVLLLQMPLTGAEAVVWVKWKWQVASWSLQMQQVLMHMPNKAMLLDSQPCAGSECKQQLSVDSTSKTSVQLLRYLFPNVSTA